MPWQQYHIFMWLTREEAIDRAHRAGSWGWRHDPGEWVRASDQQLHDLLDRCETYVDFIPCEEIGRMVARRHYKAPFVRYRWVDDDTG